MIIVQRPLKLLFNSLSLILILTVVTACSETYGPDVSRGEYAPASNNKPIPKTGTWRDVCSMDVADKLHRHRIADLRQAQKPFLVVFGTPQHCTMCVDQLVRVASLQEKYGERFAFLHVDGYRDDAVWVEWGIKGEPWTFIVDAQGVVRKVFPGPTDGAVMEQVIDEILQGTG